MLPSSSGDEEPLNAIDVIDEALVTGRMASLQLLLQAPPHPPRQREACPCFCHLSSPLSVTITHQ